MSDLENNTFKISVPIITNEELEKLDYTIENDLDNIVHQISKTVSRDKDIIILKKVIEKQSKEIEKLKKENLEIRDWKYVIDSPIDLDKLKELDLIKIKGKDYVSKDKIKAKIEELDNTESDKKYTMLFNSDNVMNVVKAVLQSLLEKE